MSRRPLLLSLPLVLLGPTISEGDARLPTKCAWIPDSVLLRSRVQDWLRSAVTVLEARATVVGVFTDTGIVNRYAPSASGPIGAEVIVSRWWKGRTTDTVFVAWQPSANEVISEVFPLVAGQRYVLFLSRRGGHYWSGGCGGSSGGPRADSIAVVLDSLSR